MKTNKPVQTGKIVKSNQVSTSIPNPEYSNKLSELAACRTTEKALFLIADLLVTCQRLTSIAKRFDPKTGKPVEFSVKDDLNSQPDVLRYVPFSEMGVKVHPMVAKRLNYICDDISVSREAVLLSDESGAKLVITSERVSTGGGHNSTTTYADALIFRAISKTYFQGVS